MVYPVWIRLCCLKLQLYENCAPQVSHLRDLSRVDMNMSLQTTTVRELCMTGITFVRFIPSVDTDMCLQTTIL